MTRRSITYRTFLAGVMMAIYLLSFLDKGHFHLHHHADHEHSLHSEKCGEDSCHVALYHFGAKSCGHKAHFIPVEESCLDCHEILQVQYLQSLNEKAVTESYAQILLEDLDDKCDFLTLYTISVRGPPTNIS